MIVKILRLLLKGPVAAAFRKLDREQELRAQGIEEEEPASQVRERARRQRFIAREVAFDVQAHHRRRARQICRRLEHLYGKARARREDDAPPAR